MAAMALILLASVTLFEGTVQDRYDNLACQLFST